MGFADVLLDEWQEDGVEKDLGRLRLCGDEDSGCCVGCVGGPVIGTCDGNESFPGGDCGEDLEGLG